MSGPRPSMSWACKISSFRPAGRPEKERHSRPAARLKRGNALFGNPKGGEISEDVRTAAPPVHPSQVPVGTYTAETFLIDEGKVIAAATRDVEIGASGFERFVALAARRHEFFYGLAAVLMSLGLGWAAALVFRKRV